MDAWAALSWGAREVTVVEPNPKYDRLYEACQNTRCPCAAADRPSPGLFGSLTIGLPAHAFSQSSLPFMSYA